MKVDVYREWLGISSDTRPPRPHELLGLTEAVSDKSAINEAAQKQLARLDPYAAHPDRKTRDAAAQLMNELARARNKLVERSRKSKPVAPTATPVAKPPKKRTSSAKRPVVRNQPADRSKLGVFIGVGAGAFVLGVVLVALLLYVNNSLLAGPDHLDAELGVDKSDIDPQLYAELQLRVQGLEAEVQSLYRGVDDNSTAVAEVPEKSPPAKRVPSLDEIRELIDPADAGKSREALRLIEKRMIDFANDPELSQLRVRVDSFFGPKHGSALHLKSKIETIYIRPDVYTRGSQERRGPYAASLPAHEVTFNQGFYIGVTEVTIGQWKQVMGDVPEKLESYRTRVNRPISYISREDANEFCRRLSESENLSIRLPTEAEWEFACRAGTTTPYWSGDTITDEHENLYPGFILGSGQRHGTRHARLVAVQAKIPNPWGLYDMHGNVGEWCSDWYGPYPLGAVQDPKGPMSGQDGVVRGGSYLTIPILAGSSIRDHAQPQYTSANLGFRIVIDGTEMPAIGTVADDLAPQQQERAEGLMARLYAAWQSEAASQAASKLPGELIDEAESSAKTSNRNLLPADLAKIAYVLSLNDADTASAELLAVALEQWSGSVTAQQDGFEGKGVLDVQTRRTIEWLWRGHLAAGSVNQFIYKVAEHPLSVRLEMFRAILKLEVDPEDRQHFINLISVCLADDEVRVQSQQRAWTGSVTRLAVNEQWGMSDLLRLVWALPDRYQQSSIRWTAHRLIRQDRKAMASELISQSSYASKIADESLWSGLGKVETLQLVGQHDEAVKESLAILDSIKEKKYADQESADSQAHTRLYCLLYEAYDSLGEIEKSRAWKKKASEAAESATSNVLKTICINVIAEFEARTGDATRSIETLRSHEKQELLDDQIRSLLWSLHANYPTLDIAPFLEAQSSPRARLKTVMTMFQGVRSYDSRHDRLLDMAYHAWDAIEPKDKEVESEGDELAKKLAESGRAPQAVDIVNTFTEPERSNKLAGILQVGAGSLETADILHHLDQEAMAEKRWYIIPNMIPRLTKAGRSADAMKVLTIYREDIRSDRIEGTLVSVAKCLVEQGDDADLTPLLDDITLAPYVNDVLQSMVEVSFDRSDAALLHVAHDFSIKREQWPLFLIESAVHLAELRDPRVK